MAVSRITGVGWGRRIGFLGTSRPSATQQGWTPAEDTSVLLWWDPESVPAGAVTTWTDEIAGLAATAPTAPQQPTASRTSLGGFPGVSNAGGDKLAAASAGAILSGVTQFTVTFAAVDSSTGARAFLCYGNTALLSPADGQFRVGSNSTLSSDNVSGIVRGTTNYTSRGTTPRSLATPTVMTVGFAVNSAGAAAVPFIRANGVNQGLSNTAILSAAGSLSSTTLHMFEDGTGAAGWVGTIGNIVIRTGSTVDAGLQAIEQFVATRAGITF